MQCYEHISGADLGTDGRALGIPRNLPAQRKKISRTPNKGILDSTMESVNATGLLGIFISQNQTYQAFHRKQNQGYAKTMVKLSLLDYSPPSVHVQEFSRSTKKRYNFKGTTGVFNFQEQ